MALELVERCSTRLNLIRCIARATHVCGDGMALPSGGENLRVLSWALSWAFSWALSGALGWALSWALSWALCGGS